MRLFVAVRIPEAQCRALAAIIPDIPRIRPVRLAQMHLTLRFLGDQADDLGLRRALRDVRQPRFPLSIQGVGTFGHPPHVMFAGLQDSAAVAALADAINGALDPVQDRPRDRPFAPHVTLARLKTPPPHLVRKFVESHAEFSLEPFIVESFDLVSSVLTQSGPIYEVRESFALD